ncbi:hypothetical protein ACLOJK_031653 [Asimina triloba]
MGYSLVIILEAEKTVEWQGFASFQKAKSQASKQAADGAETEVCFKKPTDCPDSTHTAPGACWLFAEIFVKDERNLKGTDNDDMQFDEKLRSTDLSKKPVLLLPTVSWQMGQNGPTQEDLKKSKGLSGLMPLQTSSRSELGMEPWQDDILASHAVAAAAAVSIGSALTHPLETLKTLVQVGSGPNQNLTATQVLRRVQPLSWIPDGREDGYVYLSEALLAGFAAGAMETVLSTPLEFFKLRAQVSSVFPFQPSNFVEVKQSLPPSISKLLRGYTPDKKAWDLTLGLLESLPTKGSKISGALKEYPWLITGSGRPPFAYEVQGPSGIISLEGWGALWRGLRSGIFRDSVFGGVFFSTWQFLHIIMLDWKAVAMNPPPRSIEEIRPVSPLAASLAAGFSGSVAAAVSHCFDTAKCRTQCTVIPKRYVGAHKRFGKANLGLTRSVKGPSLYPPWTGVRELDVEEHDKLYGGILNLTLEIFAEGEMKVTGDSRQYQMEDDKRMKRNISRTVYLLGETATKVETTRCIDHESNSDESSSSKSANQLIEAFEHESNSDDVRWVQESAAQVKNSWACFLQSVAAAMQVLSALEEDQAYALIKPEPVEDLDPFQAHLVSIGVEVPTMHSHISNVANATEFGKKGKMVQLRPLRGVPDLAAPTFGPNDLRVLHGMGHASAFRLVAVPFSTARRQESERLHCRHLRSVVKREKPRAPSRIDFPTMPQGDYIQLHQKRYGCRLDHFERKRKEAWHVHKHSAFVPKMNKVHEGALPAYLLDCETTTRTKVLKFQVRPVAEDEMCKIIRSGKRKTVGASMDLDLPPVYP